MKNKLTHFTNDILISNKFSKSSMIMILL